MSINRHLFIRRPRRKTVFLWAPPPPPSLSHVFQVFFVVTGVRRFLSRVYFICKEFILFYIYFNYFIFIYLFYIYFINLFYILFLILFFILKGIFCKLVKVYDTIKCIKYLTSENLKEEKILLCINIILYINLEILNCRKDWIELEIRRIVMNERFRKCKYENENKSMYAS